MQPLELVITETQAGGIFQRAGQWVEQQHGRGIHLQLGNRLLQQNIQSNMDIHTGADSNIDFMQCRQVVQALLRLGKQAGILDIGCSSIGNQGK